MTTPAVRTTWRPFGGFNVKGVPAMSQRQVLHDLRIIRRNVVVASLQEFKHSRYWSWMRRALPRTGRQPWRSYPDGYRGPRSSQPVIWRARVYDLVEGRQRELHGDQGAISQARYVTAALLRDRATGLRCWYVSAHFVVRGDQPSDTERRRTLLEQDLQEFELFLDQLADTGHPIVGELDANLPGSQAHRMPQVAGNGIRRVRYLGRRGIEYAFVVDGSDVSVETRNVREVADARLYTDHEGRVFGHRLVVRRAR